MISKSLSEYLKTIYILQVKNQEIRVTDIAIEMNCSKPSVNKALTKEGEDLAKKILEAYDIVYIFLKDVLGLTEEDAKSEAEKIKLTLTDNTINKLAKYVYKQLNLDTLNCNYDIANKRCLECERRKIKKSEKVEE